MSEEVTKDIKDPEGLLKAYEKAKADLVAMRAENKELKSTVESLEANGSEGDAWKNRAVQAEIRLALQKEGIKDVDRLMPYVGNEGIDFDEEGNLSGLSDRMETLKKDLPELFDAKRRVGGRADIFAENPTSKTPSASETQVQQLMGA